MTKRERTLYEALSCLEEHPRYAGVRLITFPDPSSEQDNRDFSLSEIDKKYSDTYTQKELHEAILSLAQKGLVKNCGPTTKGNGICWELCSIIELAQKKKNESSQL